MKIAMAINAVTDSQNESKFLRYLRQINWALGLSGTASWSSSSYVTPVGTRKGQGQINRALALSGTSWNKYIWVHLQNVNFTFTSIIPGCVMQSPLFTELYIRKLSNWMSSSWKRHWLQHLHVMCATITYQHGSSFHPWWSRNTKNANSTADKLTN